MPIFLGYNIFYTAFNAANGLLWNEAALGIYFSILSILIVIIEGPILVWISKIYTDTLLFIGGSFLLATIFLLIAFGTYTSSYVALIFLHLEMDLCAFPYVTYI